MKPEKPNTCSLCKREVELSFHHLVPKKMHDKRWVVQKHADKELIHYGIWVCEDCHKKIHRLFDHQTLAEHYFTKDTLLQHEKLRKFVNWVSKQRKKVKRKPHRRN